MGDARGSGRAQGRVGSTLRGKWRIDERIGSGGMATVYAATHRNGHRAAIKMLHEQLSREPEVRARFLREAYVANAVSHPGVVRVEDDDVSEDGAVFLVLELLEGETIEARRARMGGALPIDDVLDLADQALDALAAAHDKGIVHRDVKPDNVFVTSEGRVKLLDFGLARMKNTQAEETKTGITIGTPEFMPPEQARGRRDSVDARSDVWGLGATLFTAITGKYVHDADNLRDQLVASATARARSIRTVAPHVPASVADVIDRALELDQDDRWSSAREMQRAFRAARGGASSPRVFEADSVTMPASFASATVSTSPRPLAGAGTDAGARSEVGSGATVAMTGALTGNEDTVAMAGSLGALAAAGAPAARPSAPPSGPASGPASARASARASAPPPTPAPATARLSGSAVVRTSAPPPPPQVAAFSSAPPPTSARPPAQGPTPTRPEERSASSRAPLLLALVFFALFLLVAAYLFLRARGLAPPLP